MNEVEQAMAVVNAELNRVDRRKLKQTEKSIFENCKKKYLDTQKRIEELKVKVQKIEDEITHLQQKQLDRKKFLDDTIARHKKN